MTILKQQTTFQVILHQCYSSSMQYLLFPKNSANLSKCAILKWQTTLAGPFVIDTAHLSISQNLLAGFLKTLPPSGPFPSKSFFFSAKKLSRVAIVKTESATIGFFSSPPFFLLALSFSPFLFLQYVCFWSFMGPKNPSF